MVSACLLGNSVIFPGILGFVTKYCMFSISVLHCYILFAADAMDIAHNTTITLEFHGRISFPTWYMDGYPVLSGTLYLYDHSTGDLLSILTIDGNETCGIVDVSCTLDGQGIVYTERLNIEGL